MERILISEERIKDDHLLSAGDSGNKTFWIKTFTLADHIVKRFVILKD
jgi:hypothetical protein